MDPTHVDLLAWWIYFKMDQHPNADLAEVRKWVVEFESLSPFAIHDDLQREYAEYYTLFPHRIPRK